MGDLKTSEAYVDVVFITPKNSVTGQTGLTPTCYSVKSADNTRTALTVSELGSGWYKASFTNDAAGTWMTEWAVSGSYTVHGNFKFYKVDGGQIGDINTALAVVDGYHDVPTADVATNTTVRDVVGNKDDTVAGTSIVALVKAVKAKTDNLPTDPADDSDLDTQLVDIEGKVDDLETRLTALRAGYLDNLSGGAVALQSSVDDLEGRLTALRAGYLDNLSAGAVAQAATALTNATWTDARAGYIDELAAANLPTDIAIIDGYHDVTAAADSAANSQMRDVLGRKDDTVVGDSAIALLKQIEGAGFATGTDSLKILSDMLDTIRTEATFAGGNPDTLLNQATPVQNTWYTILDTTANCRIEQVAIAVATTGETLQLRITRDGYTYLGEVAAAADTDYYASYIPLATNTDWELSLTTSVPSFAFLMEGRSIKVEVRKTSAAGTGNLKGRPFFSAR